MLKDWEKEQFITNLLTEQLDDIENELKGLEYEIGKGVSAYHKEGTDKFIKELRTYMEYKNKDASLNQVSELSRILQEDEVLQTKYDLTDTWSKLDGITEKQYKYILYLLFSKKRNKLNKILIQLGFNKKI